jgi:hypothetical protein
MSGFLSHNAKKVIKTAPPDTNICRHIRAVEMMSELAVIWEKVQKTKFRLEQNGMLLMGLL